MHTLSSIAVLICSAMMGAISAWSFVHARLSGADTAELDRLYQQRRFVNGSTLEQNYCTLTQLISAVAPAVYMRQEVWVQMYYWTLRAATRVSALASTAREEMRRLVAYQANRYNEACSRLAEMVR